MPDVRRTSATPIRGPRLANVLRLVARACLLALPFAVAVAGAVMFVAWQHNPLGEFHAEDGIHWSAWLSVGWPIVAMIVVPAALITAVFAAFDRSDQQ